MSRLVSQVISLWQGADGSLAECVEEGSPLDAIESFKWVRKLQDPARRIAVQVLLEDGTRSSLPFVRGSVCRLPDRTGVVAIFSPGQYTKLDGSDHFPEPNNAAVFNADGSLRFQLNTNGRAHRIAAFHGGAMPDHYASHMGLLIATHEDAQPEWVYAVDPNQPELISTGQWVRY